MLLVDTDPPEKELWGDAEEFAEAPDCLLPQEICPENLKDERQGILAIRDNEIRKDGMGMATAFTPDPVDTQYTLMNVAIKEIDQVTVV